MIYTRDTLPSCSVCGVPARGSRIRDDGETFFCELHAAMEPDFLSPDDDLNVQWQKIVLIFDGRDPSS